MSHDTKADQIAFHFYTKLFYVVNDARNTASVASSNGRVDKWFNLETPDSDLWSKEAREPYKTISAPRLPPPLEIQVLLTIPDTMTSNQALVYIAPDSSRVRVEPTPKHVLLESWVLAFSPRDHRPSSSDADVALSTIYKHGIPLFRSLYSLLRILPTWKLAKRLRRSGGLAVQVRVRGDIGSGVDETSVMRFDSLLALPTSTYNFQPIMHPMGTLTVSSTYLTTPNFRLDELESLLSSRFMSMDTAKGIEFTPTLVKNQQRDSMLSSAGRSTGTTASLPRSPPRDILRPNPSIPPYAFSHSRSTSDTDSIAERFVLPSRTASNPSSNLNHPILPITRATTTTSTSTQPLSVLAARLRKESLHTASDSNLPTTSTQPFPSSSSSSISNTASGTGTSAPTTSTLSSSPVAMRRPGINPVNPFKSNTLAGNNSGAIGVGSSNLGGLAALSLGSSPARTGVSAMPAGNTSLASLSSLSNLSNLPGTIPARPSFPSIGNRPSPPSFAPSSLGTASSSSGSTAGLVAAGTTTTVPGTGEIAVPPRKRYSSSFGHRYSSIGSTHSGSPRSGIGAGGAEVGSLGQGSVKSGRSAGSGSGGGSAGREGLGRGLAGTGMERDSRTGLGNTPSADPDLNDQPEQFTHDYHDDISSFMQDIDERKPLSGRSRIFANAQSPVFDEDREMDQQDRDDRQRTIRAHTSRDDSREKFAFGSASSGSGSLPLSRGTTGEAVPPSPLGPGGLASLGRRLSGGAGSSSPSSLAAPPSPRKVSYTGAGTGLSPPSSPLRNAIPLAAEEDDRGPSVASPTEYKPTSPTTSRPFRSSFSSSAAPNLPLSNTRTRAGSAGGNPASPPTHSSPMLTSASEVDARLKKMNDVFLASLEGLGGGGSGKGKGRWEIKAKVKNVNKMGVIHV
ncbi:hypothetical protein BT96DRAFT_939518 [Gymnopus androsaceus JB14]|uniref:Autophagy-related protein 13 n=1 Tax=Gymnopus androsaceus JB14 TaxID=1447944 RepID=A0A6A4HLE1_9AGAR|nr:hypothetical protein BT96DRAFT_939518 [Gymnopus androsaceus JB14]